MAIDTIKQVGIAPLQDLLGQLTKILTVDDAAFGTAAQLQAQDAKDISDAILFLEHLNIPHFVSLGVGSDDKNPVWQKAGLGDLFQANIRLCRTPKSSLPVLVTESVCRHQPTTKIRTLSPATSQLWRRCSKRFCPTRPLAKRWISWLLL